MGPKIRLALFSEQRELARVYTAAFWDDILFGDLIHPHRKEFPEDNQLYWLRRIQVYWWDYTHHFIVSTAVDKQGDEVIAGVAHWSRMGTGGRAAGLGWCDPRRLAKPTATACAKLSSYVYRNRAADPANEFIIERSYPFLGHIWTGSRSESWYLEALGVHPDYQSQGHGRALVAWGMEQAEKEGVACSVISAWGKEMFYRNCGFDKEDCGHAGQGDGNPLADVKGGIIFFKDAPGKEEAEGKSAARPWG